MDTHVASHAARQQVSSSAQTHSATAGSFVLNDEDATQGWFWPQGRGVMVQAPVEGSHEATSQPVATHGGMVLAVQTSLLHSHALRQRSFVQGAQSRSDLQGT